MSVLGPLLFFASAAASLFSSRKTRKNHTKTDLSALNSDEIKVKEIWIYPIKGCRGFKVSSWPIYRRGFAFDRLFMVVDEKGKFVSQRSHPLMTKILTKIDENMQTMSLNYPGMEQLSLNIESVPTGESLRVNVWGDICDATELVEGSKWISTALGDANLKLVRMNDNFVRNTDEKYAPEGQTGFSDGFPFLLASQAGLDDLNNRLKTPVLMENFRANIIVDGCSAFEEDLWGKLQFIHSKSSYSIDMEIVKPCSRCKVPNNDVENGIFNEQNEPTETMKKFRTGGIIGFKNEKWAKALFFGQNVDHRGQSGRLEVGDRVKVVSLNDFFK